MTTIVELAKDTSCPDISGRHVVARIILGMMGSLLLASVSLAAGGTFCPHLNLATTLVSTVQPEYNDYGGTLAPPTPTSYIHWQGIDGAPLSENYTVCGTFITLLLRQAYHCSGNDMSNWIGSISPYPADYYDTIKNARGFLPVTLLRDIQPGDLIAIKYYPKDPSNRSGHLMLVRVLTGQPRTASKPIVTGTTQYELTVTDSSSSYHGTTDTRVNGVNSTYSPDKGVGSGVIRLYAGSNGSIAGYTWSTSSGSTYYSQTARPLVIGRLQLNADNTLATCPGS